MAEAYIIEELWTDSMENEISAARGYAVIAVTLDKDLADRVVSEAGVVPERVGWPNVSGWPRKRVIAKELLS